MKSYKRLNILGTKLDEEQIDNYIEKLAYQFNIINISNPKTYPLKKLKDDYKVILETYILLNDHLKKGIKIHSAGEWVLDNFYIIEENVKIIEKELSLKKYKKLPGISEGELKGFARIYILASEIVNITDFNINENSIKKVLNVYQNKKVLNIEEIVLLPFFIKIVLINKIRDICEQILSSQVQKIKVEDIIKRLIEKKENKIRWKNIKVVKFNDNSKYSFIEYMSYRLKKYGKKTIDFQKILELEVEKAGMTISEVIQKEHFYIASLKIVIRKLY